MTVESIIKAGGKALTQVMKKTYVKPTCELVPIKSFCQKLERESSYLIQFPKTAMEEPSGEKLYKSLRKYLFEEEKWKISQFDFFSKLKITKHLNDAEKQSCFNILTFRGNGDIFYPTLLGAKPACILGNFNSMEALGKLHLGKNIELIHADPFSPAEGFNFFNTYVLNKKETLKIIKRNKDIYTTGLGLSKDVKLNDIYLKLKEFLHSVPATFGSKHQDIVGITLGFPKYSSMIFELDQAAKIDARLRGTTEYIEKLLEVLHSPSSPYISLPQKEFKTLEDKIKQISAEKLKDVARKGSYDDGIYKFIKFVDEPRELARIEKNINHFQNTFIASNL